MRSEILFINLDSPAQRILCFTYCSKTFPDIPVVRIHRTDGKSSHSRSWTRGYIPAKAAKNEAKFGLSYLCVLVVLLAFSEVESASRHALLPKTLGKCLRESPELAHQQSAYSFPFTSRNSQKIDR